MSVKSYGQTSSEAPKRTAVVEALLDSAVKYERIKIAIAHLETAHEFKTKEVDSLKEALRLSELQVAVQKQQFTETAKPKRKPFWNGFKTGFVSGLILTTALFIL